jgi:hypothetical protein
MGEFEGDVGVRVWARRDVGAKVQSCKTQEEERGAGCRERVRRAFAGAEESDDQEEASGNDYAEESAIHG